jgi:predicted  nucleic acid-binding Zn-ribbon protein
MTVTEEGTRRAGLTPAESLLQLNDLDALLHEIDDPLHQTRLRKLGFEIRAAERLRPIRARLAAGVDARWLGIYDRARVRYGRGLASVRERVCTGCFLTLPTTARRPGLGEQVLTTCQGCQRILIWG